MFGLPTLVTRIAVGAIFVICVLGFLQVRSCQQAKQRAAEARVERAQSKAVVESAKDAIATQEASHARERASEQLTVKNTEEIRNAEGASVQIHPDVSATALRGLCRRAVYREHPRCAVQQPAPARVD